MPIPLRRPVVLVAIEVRPYGGATATLRLSGGGTTTRYGGFHWPDRLLPEWPDISEDITISSSGALGGGGVAQLGNLRLANADGVLDLLITGAADGRPITMWRGEDGADFGTFAALYAGRVQDVTYDADEVTVTVADLSDRFDERVQQFTYAGTGGLEGPSDMTGVPKPIVWGEVRKIEPVVINAALQIYQVMDGPFVVDPAGFVANPPGSISPTWPRVWDRGQLLTYDSDIADVTTWTPVGGRYVVNSARGIIRLGVAPDGPLVADIKSIFFDTAADIIADGAVNRTTIITPADVDVGSFSILAAAQPAVLGIFDREGQLTLRALLDRCMTTVGGYWRVNALGKLAIRRVEFRTPAWEIPSSLIIDQSGKRVERQQTAVPPWIVQLNYRRVYRVHAAGEAGTLAAIATREFSVVENSDGNVRIARPNAGRLEVTTDFGSFTDANIERGRQLGVLSQATVPQVVRGRRDLFRVPTRDADNAAELGDTVTWSTPRFGPRRSIVVGRTQRIDGREQEWRLWG